MATLPARRELPAILRSIACGTLLAVLPVQTSAQLLRIDASAAIAPPTIGYLKMGTGTGPSGHISINNRYIERDGKPWIPVMGEFHYSRFPAEYWEEELLKIKASGIDTVATYVIWNQHELAPGRLDWTGNRDLRRFAQLCAKHGLLLFLRPGPWAHAETRFGGLPDWVVDRTRRRSNDPAYMAEVERYLSGIADQVRGLLWKDGGPVIGLQIENEYNLAGPGRGEEHIVSLKQLARKQGIDVPLYTVTGWDNAVYPRGEVAPVVGGYVDEPWSTLKAEMPPRENYVFRFASRVTGGLGAQTQGDAARIPDAEKDRDLTPFLGAEYGPGLPVMYRRRPLVAPDDVAATIVTQIGSGLNLLGYYMYHGGANPIADGRGLEETTATGSYNDVPRIAYDFQAPLGQYGEVNEVQNYLRPLHYFLHSYGARLARMTLRRPDVVPSGPGDLDTPRIAARSDGASGFVFVNNHVRQYRMANHPAVRFEVATDKGVLRFPSRPIAVKNGSYFFFPYNLDLGGPSLAWASAQPITSIADRDGPLHIFMQVEGIPAEFAFDAETVGSIEGRTRRVDGRIIADLAPSRTRVTVVRDRQGVSHRFLLLSEAEARSLWVGDVLGARRLILTDASVTMAQDSLVLRQRANPDFRFAVWPRLPQTAGARPERGGGIFQLYRAGLEARTMPRPDVRKIREPAKVPALQMTGPRGSAVQPAPEAFAAAGAWRLTVPKGVLSGVDDAWLTIDFTGDIARLFDRNDMLDDAFWDGRKWNIGLKRFAARLGRPWDLTILPLRGDAPIYLDAAVRPRIGTSDQIGELRSVALEPEYKLVVSTNKIGSVPMRDRTFGEAAR
ncbi:MAG: beta-galactosidase [Sphingomicrobium sp.]